MIVPKFKYLESIINEGTEIEEVFRDGNLGVIGPSMKERKILRKICPSTKNQKCNHYSRKTNQELKDLYYDPIYYAS